MSAVPTHPSTTHGRRHCFIMGMKIIGMMIMKMLIIRIMDDEDNCDNDEDGIPGC